MAELQKAISRTGNSSPGPDGIPYIVLRNLPLPTLRVLLALYNRIWSDGTFPSIWHDAHVICIPKPNKDSSNPLNYRPISLTNCLCKILERIVCNRLTFHLENNGLLHDMQSGFRCGRSTTDHLVTLETFIREALVAKQHTLSVFFDVEAAYDRCWKYGALRDLHRLGIRGRLPIFIANFLHDRIFKVRLGSHLSDWLPQKEGFPQGSLLSILLFILQMDGLKRFLPQNSRDVLASLYVDDLAISVRSRNLATAEKTLQNIINNVNRWAVSNGMKFSSTKSVCVDFNNKRGIRPDPTLKIGDDVIQSVESVKFLGVHFDRRLTFKPHLQYTKTRCLKALTLLKVTAARGLGADRDAKLMLYRALVRSKLDYGSIVYSSARPSYLKTLDTIQNQGLRIALNAYRTSPAASLRVEANERPIDLRHLQLAMMYFTKCHANDSNPARQSTENESHDVRFALRHRFIRPLRHRVQDHLENASIDMQIIHSAPNPLSPPPPPPPLPDAYEPPRYLQPPPGDFSFRKLI